MTENKQVFVQTTFKNNNNNNKTVTRGRIAYIFSRPVAWSCPAHQHTRCARLRTSSMNDLPESVSSRH